MLGGALSSRRGFGRHRVAAVLGLLIAVGLLTWTFRDVSLGEVWGHVRAADPNWLLAMVLAATATFPLRAARWHWLLLGLHRETRFGSRFGAVCIGFMANNLLPARLGEFARAFALSRVEPVRASGVLGSLVVERVFDGLVLASLLVVSLLRPGSPVEGPPAASTIGQLAIAGGGVFAGAWLSLWLLARHSDRALRFFEATIAPRAPQYLAERVQVMFEAFLGGIGALHNAPVFLRTLAWTLAVWLTGAASIWCGLRAFGIERPGILGAVLLQSVIGFAVAIPSSPGFFGPFEAACRIGLALYGVEAAQTVSFAVVYHVLTFLPVTLLGFWYLHRLGLRLTQLEQSEEIVEREAGRE